MSESHTSSRSDIRHSIFPFSSQLNRRRFQSKPQHLTVAHAPGKKFKCSHCPKTFSGSTQLKVHSRIHTRVGLYHCSECPMKCTSAGNLKSHLVQHTRTSDHMCPFCSYPAASRVGLENHMTTHTGERPFPCSLCPKAFGMKSGLTSHNLRIHSGAGRRHKCQFCDYAGKVKGDVTRHLATHKETKYKCKFCGRGFKNFSTLTQHIRIHAKNAFKCSVCQRSFASLRACKAHARTQHEGLRFTCGVCGREFRSSNGRKFHVASHKAAAGYCAFCNKTQGKFLRMCDLNFHRRIHIGRKLWECGACKVNFKWKLDLASHQKMGKCLEKRKAEVLIRESQVILQRI